VLLHLITLFSLLRGPSHRYFPDEIHTHLRHDVEGALSMAHPPDAKDVNASQFFITAAPRLTALDERYTVFGRVAEGMDVVHAISEAWADEKGRPYQNIRSSVLPSSLSLYPLLPLY